MKPELRQILHRNPERFLIEGLDQAPDELLHDFVIHKNDPENAERQHLVERAEAVLKKRESDRQAERDRQSVRQRDEDREERRRDRRWGLWAFVVAVVSLIVAILSWLVRVP